MKYKIGQKLQHKKYPEVKLVISNIYRDGYTIRFLNEKTKQNELGYDIFKEHLDENYKEIV